eukprot:s365_g4.t1
MFHPLECEEWHQIPMTLATQCIGWVVSFTCCAMGSFVMIMIGWDAMSHLGLCPPRQHATSLSENVKAMIVCALVAIPPILGILGATGIMQVLNPHLRWSLFVPKHIQSCEIQLLQMPPLFPSEAGATLEPTQMTFRQHFFLSLLTLQLLTACLLGMSLTFLATICRACRRSSNPFYAPMEPEVQFTFTLVEHVSFHVFCAGITCLGVMTDSFSVTTGTSWELYILFVGAQTSSNLLEALYWAVHLPPDAGVPSFGWPVVSSVLPVLGEPLDTCKDYFFAGIALSTGSWQGLLFATIAIGILIISNTYLRNKHKNALGRDLLSVRKASFPSKAEGILATQTSPTKLAIALSEDLPQAVLQSLFVVTCGGSPTQYAFIGLSITKILCCLSLRAVALRQDDRHGEASAANVEFYQMMIFALSLVVGPQHSWMLHWKFWLARSLGEVGRLQEALAMHEEVLEVRRQVLGPRHPETLRTQNNVASSLDDVGRHQEALEMYQEVLEVQRQVLGPRHPDTLSTQHNVAFILGKVGRHQESLAVKEEVLEVRRQVLGPRHPETLATQSNVAWSLCTVGQHQEALAMFEEVLEVERQVLGPRHPHTLRTQSNVAGSFYQVGRHQEALEMYEEVLEVRRQVLGPRHPDSLTTQHNMASSLSTVGRHQEALAMYEEVLEVQRQVLGLRHPDTLRTQNNVASSLDDVGRHQEALAMFHPVDHFEAEMNQRPILAGSKGSGATEEQGIGMMGEGVKACGLSVCAANDISSSFCQFQVRQGQQNVIQGDIGCPEVIAGVHAAHPRPSLITAGFSCQPWSQLGDGGQSNDPRSNCLVKVLEMAFWLRAFSVLLECVEAAGRDPEVQAVIRHFCSLMGFRQAQTDLHLGSIMPAKRSRWWCLLTRGDIPDIRLRPLPVVQPPPVLGDLLPFCPSWDEYDMHQLCLDRYETNKFMEFEGLYSNIVDTTQQVKTALHGWSNQLSGCPCGCRSHAFSESRLREKGIFGALVPTEGFMNTYLGKLPNTRHLHPWELSLIHGAKPNRIWKPSLRLSIAGLGQMAAPLQSCWVVGHLMQALELEGKSICPETYLWHQVGSVLSVVQAEHPSLFQHPNVQSFASRIHQALGQSAQAQQGPVCSIGSPKEKEETNSHREGRKNPKNEEPGADKKADRTQELVIDQKQPGPGTPEPEKKTHQPGPRTREPEKMDVKQPGRGAPEPSDNKAMETLELPPPMCLQAKPLDAFVTNGPSPRLCDDKQVNASGSVCGIASFANSPKAAQPMIFHAMPGDSPGVTGPSPFPTKTKVSEPPPPAQCTSREARSEAVLMNLPDLPKGAAIMEPALKKPRTEAVISSASPSVNATGCEQSGVPSHDAPCQDRSKAAQPMVFQAMPGDSNEVTGPAPFPPKTESQEHSKPAPPLEPLHLTKETQGSPQAVVASGGIVAFANLGETPKGNFSPHEECVKSSEHQEDSLTQEMLAAVEKIDEHVVPPAASPVEVSKHVVQVIHDHAKSPMFVSMSKVDTVGSITVAEDKLHVMSQPIRANTCLGTMLRCASTTTPFQQVFLRSIDHCFEGHSCDEGKMPFALYSNIPCSRLQVLFHQEAWVAADEMEYYLSMMTATGSSRHGPIFLMPLSVLDEDMEPLLQRWICQLAPAEAASGMIVTALWVSHHWFPVVIALEEGSIHITTTPGGKDWIILATRGLGNHFTVSTTPITQVFNNDCGFQAVGWLINALFDPEFHAPAYKPRPVDETAAISWRGLFEYHLHTQGLAQEEVIPSNLTFGGVANQDLPTQLSQLLQERGVPQSEVEARTEATLTKVGRQPVMRAMRSKEPWKELKQLCNQLTPKHQLVLPSEMQAAIEARAGQDKPFGDRSRKIRDLKPAKQIQLSAEDVTVPDGIFCDQHQRGLGQIPFSSIGPEARGIVVIQAANVVPYIRNGQPISKSALGLIVVDHHAPILEGIGTLIRFPARCEKTGEAILLTGRLIQLGTLKVTRSAPEAQTRVEEVGNQVVRTVTYRDELENIPWAKFIERPIRHIIQAIPALQGDSQHSPIIDIWDRQFLTTKLDKCHPGSAEVFMACFRLESKSEPLDLQSSGIAGHYLEPRSVDGRSPDPAFRVIWLKGEKQQVVLAAQSTSQWNSVVRSGRRFGLRVKLADAEAVHMQHKPTTPFLDSDKLLTFHAGPFPHGTNRAALLKLFAQWQWAARPCQPKSRAPNGLGVHWEIQATAKPPYEVYQLQHADVLITEVVKKSPKQIQPGVDVQGSAKTIAALTAKTDASSSHDPWASDDPWKGYQPTAKAAKVSDGTRTDQVDMIVAKVLQKIQPPGLPHHTPMDDGDTPMGGDDRVVDLEQRMNSLEMTMQSNHQKQEVRNQEVDLKLSGLQDQVDQQSSDLKEHIDHKMDQQLSQIERLLLAQDPSKKPRHE